MADYASNISFEDLAGDLSKQFNKPMTPQAMENLRAMIQPSKVLDEKQQAAVAALSQFKTEDLRGDIANTAANDIDSYRKWLFDTFKSNKGTNKFNLTPQQQVESNAKRTKLSQDIAWATDKLKNYETMLFKALPLRASGAIDGGDMDFLTAWTERNKGLPLPRISDPNIELAKTVDEKPIKDMALNKVYDVLNYNQDNHEPWRKDISLGNFESNYKIGSKDFESLKAQLINRRFVDKNTPDEQIRDWLLEGAMARDKNLKRAPWRGTPTNQPYTIPFTRRYDGKYEANLGSTPVKYRARIGGKWQNGYVVSVLGDGKMTFVYNEKIPDPNSFDVINPDMVTDTKEANIDYDPIINKNIDNGRGSLGDFPQGKQSVSPTEKKTKKTATDYNL
ncbi:MAG: hypothetical protein PHS93_09345 [Candidatus Omnitrophica bacterium]|nr:hypothetical protein [Candidatus Omnitrophota bacterium]